MAPENKEVPISYCCLLRQMLRCLGFPDPTYSAGSVVSNSVRLDVETMDLGPFTYTYEGGVASSIEGSCEKAAEDVVRDLRDEYDIRIHDLTYERIKKLERCANLFDLKRADLEQTKKKKPEQTKEKKPEQTKDKQAGPPDVEKKGFDVYHFCRNPSDERRIVPIDQVQRKTLDNTLLEENFWLQATVPEPDIEKIVAYIGCSNCGTRCDAPVKTAISCYKCPNIECTATHRAIHSFTVTDGSGMLKLTAFGEDCERLLGMTLAEIYDAATSETWDKFTAATNAIATNPLFFKIGPAYILRSAGALKWNLKYVSVE